jgi:hypothetical protein
VVASVGKLLNLLRSAEHGPNDRKESAGSIAISAKVRTKKAALAEKRLLEWSGSDLERRNFPKL